MSSAYVLISPLVTEQKPFIEKQPFERERPLLNVDVAPDVRSIAPPEITRPLVVVATPAIVNPPFAIVDDAFEMKPEVNVPNPVEYRAPLSSI